MKKRIILIIGIIILIGSIFEITIWIKNIQKDSNKSKEDMNYIQESYSSFEEGIKEYNEIRSSLTTEFQNIYMDNFANDYLKIKELFLKLEENIKENENLVTEITMTCKDRIFSENKINTICSSHQEYYEKLVNVYFNDIQKFNQIIMSYNENHEEKLEEYRSNQVTESIDYNQDGVYLEKSEEL